jgi:two-component system NtrC family sensor kinase
MSQLERLMLDHSPILSLLVDPTTLRILRANAMASSTLGYPLAQLQGMEITEIESALPDVFYWADVQRGQHQGIADQDDLYRKADGELVPVRKRVQVLTHGDEPVLLVQATPTHDERTAADVLARTLAQLRATLESTGNAILVLDAQGHIESMNHLFGQMWAIPPRLLHASDDAQILNCMVEQVVEQGLLRDRLTAILDMGQTMDRLHHHDGSVLEVTSRPQMLGEQIVGRVFGFQDITRHIQNEAALRESRDLLEQRVQARTADLHRLNATLITEKGRQADLIKKLEAAQNQLLQSERMASIGQLAAGVAHEINNPVGFVNSNLGSLQRYVEGMLRLLQTYESHEGELPEPARAAIEQVKQDVDIDFLREDVPTLLSESADGLRRVTRIVQDLKSFSHVDEAERQLADLEAGLESTLRVVWNELKYKADVVKEFAGIPKIECFPFQLNQVFMNLLVNASQALEAHGTITIRTGQDDTHVWVEVQDTGKGMAPETVGRIFEPFFTTKPVGQGTGLGLSLSYGIVKKHHGDILVHSSPGQGARFTVRLPKTPPAS